MNDLTWKQRYEASEKMREGAMMEVQCLKDTVSELEQILATVRREALDILGEVESAQCTRSLVQQIGEQLDMVRLLRSGGK